MSRKELLAEALKLSHEERERLALELYESIEAEQTPEERGAWADAWSVEIARRLEDIDAGRVKGIPADEAMASVRAAVEANRRD
jgi:putative addiction module component (TIGR02574 family)